MNSLILSAALLVLTILALSGCSNMSPQTQAILAQGAVDIGKIYVGQHSGKEPVPEDGPDAPRIDDPVLGPNFGSAKP